MKLKKLDLDNVEMFLKHWNGDIDNRAVLNLLYSQEMAKDS